jgi:hypothetical protein
MWKWIANLFKSSTFRLALLFALAVTAATSLVLIFVYWQMTKLDIAHQNRVLVDAVAKAVDQPQSQLTQELHLRLTQSLRQLDYAALFDPDGRLISGNVTTLPPDLPIDGAAHALPLFSQFDAGDEIEPALIVARRRADGGVLLLGRNLYGIYSFRQIASQALVLGLAPTIVLALVIGTIFSQRAARRFRSIDQKITRIMQGNLHERLPTNDTNDDLDRVAQSRPRRVAKRIRYHHPRPGRDNGKRISRPLFRFGFRHCAHLFVDRRKLPILARPVHHHYGTANRIGGHRLDVVSQLHKALRAGADRRDHVHGRCHRKQYSCRQLRA